MGRGAPNAETWFSDRSLGFACTRCGACCRRPGTVFVQPVEARAIAERLLGSGASPAALAPDLWEQDELGSWCIEVEEGGACPLLGPTGCTVHDIKPIQCATYPFWPEILASEADWLAEAYWCEGLCDPETAYSPDEVFDLLAECARTREAGETG